MIFLNIYLLCSLVVFLRLTKEYIDSYSHLVVVLGVVIIFILINHFSDILEIALQDFDLVDTISQKYLSAQYLLGLIEWIKQDYYRSKTKQSIDMVIKYFLFVIQNIHGYKT